MSATPPAITCPSCGAQASGRFCATCGASLQSSACAACQAPLSAGAKFCHRCGTPTGAAAGNAPRTAASTPAPPPQPGGAGATAALPWAVAGIALLALIALVAGQRFGRPPVQSADASSDAPAGVSAPMGGGASDGGGGAPDISAMSPRERADRLYDLIMQLDAQGKKDSVAFFSQMGIAAYQMLPQQDADSRYDMGRIAEVAGATEIARAQADTILAQDPKHLLGLILAISTARDVNDQATIRTLDRRLLAAEKSELARNLPEYQRHQNEITAAIAQARTDVGK